MGDEMHITSPTQFRPNTGWNMSARESFEEEAD
jgi:hypothetical protein